MVSKLQNPKEELSEEDLALKEQLELYVQIVQEPNNPLLQAQALESLKESIRTATASLTSVPKPLKFLRPHYESLKEFHESVEDVKLSEHLADVLSVLATTRSSDKDGCDRQRECLKYRLLGTEGDLNTTSWGHEYVKVLTTQIKEEYEDFDHEGEGKSQLKQLVQQIVRFCMRSNAEAEAVDLLIEVDDLDFMTLEEHLDKNNYKRTCVYLKGVAKYLVGDQGLFVMSIVYDIYLKFEKYVNALQVALFLDDKLSYVGLVFETCKDFVMRKQLCYMVARHGVEFKLDNVMVDDDDDEREVLQSIIDNQTLSQGYLTLARDIDVMEPKSPKDVYKTYLTNVVDSEVNSARQNLADTFVNAFVNAGFGQDKLMMVENPSENWLFKNKDDGKISAAASLGMIKLWDMESGIAELDKYLYSDDNHVTAGALLGIGIANTGVKNDCDPALAILSEYINNDDSSVRIAASMGLGIAYANTQNEQVRSLLSPILRDAQVPLDVLVFTAIALGLVFTGSCDEDVAQDIVTAIMDRTESSSDEPLLKLLLLGLGLLYLGQRDSDEAIAEVSELFDEKIKEHCNMILLSCAYAGTGDVLKVQEMLMKCAQHLEQDQIHQGPAVLGVAMVAMAEEIGLEMVIRSLEHMVQYGQPNIRKMVPLALALLYVSNPKANVVDMVSRLTHDSDTEVAMSAIIALGLISAGTNNARTVNLLRNLSSYYNKDANALFCVQIAQGLVHLGKGLLTLNPYHSDRCLLSPVALSGLLVMLHACLDMKNIILGKYHYVLYFLALAMQPRMLITVDENLKHVPVTVRVGQAVDVVGQAGKPKTITGFQTHSTPVLLSAGERAELATEKYTSLSPILEGFVILKKNPEFMDMDT